jgi:lipoyl-dependent peroxiredoxin
MPVRTADAEWSGSLTDGKGRLTVESGAFEGAYSFESRFEDGAHGTATNPEELLGAAHAGCFTMALSNELAKAGHPPQKAHTTAKVHLRKGEGGFEIPQIDLVLTADVPGISDEDFQRIAQNAKANCPVSKVLKAAEITLDATLTSA